MEQPEQDIATNQRPEPALQQEVKTSEEVQTSQAAAQQADYGAGAPVFRTDNVSIYYGSFKAVTDVSLTIHENEITAFIGPSGCG